MKRTALVAACLTMALIVGCGGKSAEKASEALAERMIERAARESGGNIDVDISSGKIAVKGVDEHGEAVNFTVDTDTGTMTSDNGAVSFATGEAAKIPDDFPKDVPLYKGAQLVSVHRDANAGMTSLAATSGDPASTVAEFYKKQAEANGWTQETVFSQSDSMHMMSYEKDSRELSVVIAGEGGATQIQLTLAQQ
ncbi:MAG TPA: hypothetical protein PLD73_11060 [Candidatus Hydrogenedentes bacterium]|jgi:hypothetical protein|nr:hypothetical protein [Candidatus Hydrogenedentota bacterium]HPJ99697.1 hypothetical protein [Candidatus Hydrogenedentota bacterium]